MLNVFSLWLVRFPQDPQSVAAHCFKEGMKLEAVDPAAPISIRPATVTKVTRFLSKGLPWASVFLFSFLVLLPCFYVLMSVQSHSVLAEMILQVLFIHTYENTSLECAPKSPLHPRCTMNIFSSWRWMTFAALRTQRLPRGPSCVTETVQESSLHSGASKMGSPSAPHQVCYVL